jgi:hypothetical protein
MTHNTTSCSKFMHSSIILKLQRGVHMTSYYKEFIWLDFKSWMKYFPGSYLYCLLNEKPPEYLFEMFSLKLSTWDTCTRSYLKYLYIPCHHTTKFQNSFLVLRVISGTPCPRTLWKIAIALLVLRWSIILCYFLTTKCCYHFVYCGNCMFFI